MSLSRELKGLKEKRAELLGRVCQLRDRITKEQRALNAEERSEYDRISAELLETRAKIDAAEGEFRDAADGFGIGEHMDSFGRTGRGKSDPETDAELRNTAFRAWCKSQYTLPLTEDEMRACRRVGVNPRAKEYAFRLSAGGPGREQRDQSAGTGSAGGFAVPQDFVSSLERSLKAFGGVRAVATVERVPEGRTAPMPTIDDTGNVGEILGENTGAGAQDFVFGQKTFAPIKLSSKIVKASYELMQDESANLAAEFGSLLGERIGRKEGDLHTTGTGTAQPQGVVTGATAGLTTAGSTAITAGEVIKLFHTVDPAYRASPGFRYMMHDAILQAIALLVDSQNRPLFVPSYRDGVPDRIYGAAVQVNQHMASTIATTNVTMLCGDFSRYTVRDVDPGVRLRRLEERYAELDQIGFIAFLRSDARYRNAAAVKKLTQL
jgi:HK97 family phage major capsid protein